MLILASYSNILSLRFQAGLFLALNQELSFLTAIISNFGKLLEFVNILFFWAKSPSSYENSQILELDHPSYWTTGRPSTYIQPVHTYIQYSSIKAV